MLEISNFFEDGGVPSPLRGSVADHL